jgi:hypothetical protein
VVRAAEVIQRLNKLVLQYDMNAQNLVWAFPKDCSGAVVV